MAWEKLTDEANYWAARGDEFVWRRAQASGLSRRAFLKLLAASGAIAALPGMNSPARAAALQPVLKATPAELFNDFGSNKEMRWDALFGRGYLVPNELFFVRNHTRTPSIDADKWRLKVEGSGVARGLELSYDELLAMPAVSVIRYVECAGNGRSFFEGAHGKKAQGTQWKLGAIGVAEWTGVPLRAILERAGVKKTARDVMPEGLDDLKVRRPMSLDKALEDDTLLVYAMNGQPLPPDHGFPARLLVPGWIGIASVKWVGRIEVSETPLYSNWNTDTYVMIGADYTAAPPAKGPILSRQALKSALELPWGGESPAARKILRGRAWSPAGKITGVEFSLDQGKSWQAATLREPNIAKAWVRWDAEWNARPGKYSIRVRATDEAGNRQPDRVPYNEQGYLYNAVVDHPITVL
jgi:DMSO/TMAO reductase YedYZ molybdopterin-dependent catalytic subunit